MSLLFAVSELQAEIEAFEKIAAELLGPGSVGALRTASAALTGIARKGGGRTRWCIDRSTPVVTVPSVGEYMPDDQGGLTVHGEISFVWELEPVRPGGDTRPARHVRLEGLASTMVRVLSGVPGSAAEGDGVELAVWRMEVADSAAPGAYFHVQVLGRDADTIFPKALDVPRLPGVLNSPFACMEFVLGELFQGRWSRLAQKDSSAGHRWQGIQSHRHVRHLAWATKQVTDCSGSPWAAWKAARPDESMYLPA